MLEAVDERGELGFLDLAAKPADAEAGENMLAVQLGDGATIFVRADRLTEIATDKYRYAGSFEDLRRQTTQTSQTANQPNTHEQNLAAIDARTNERGEISCVRLSEIFQSERIINE